MSTVVQGIIRQLSVSQAESFDHAQTGGCNLRWWFDVPQGVRPEQTNQQGDGEKMHSHLAHYSLTGEAPQGRVKMGTVARRTILKGELQKPGPDLFVEQRFSGQEKYSKTMCQCGHPIAWHEPADKAQHACPAAGCECAGAQAQWIPLDVSKTFKLGGVPFEGFIDLSYRRDELPTVLDYKTSSNQESLDAFAKPAKGLIKTVQMPVYVLKERARWPDAKRWRIIHHYISRTGDHSFLREAEVTLDQVLEREESIVGLIGQMSEVAKLTDQRDVPFNRKSCDTWLGCPHQSICSAYKENKMALTATEKALFDEIDGIAPALAPEDDPLFAEPAAEPEAEDPVAAAQRALDEAKARAAAAKAPGPKRDNMKVRDVESPPSNPTFSDPELPPPPKPEVPAAPTVKCACGAELTPENASKLRDGTWKHIGCPNDAAPAPVPAPKPPKKTTAPKPEAAPALIVEKTAPNQISIAPITLTLTLTPAKATEVLALLNK